MGEIDILVATGTGCIGVVVGFFSGIYAFCARADRSRYLLSLIVAVGGAAIIGFLNFLYSNGITREVFFYPIGLIPGAMLGVALSWARGWDD